jgi:hypothetical protein
MQWATPFLAHSIDDDIQLLETAETRLRQYYADASRRRKDDLGAVGNLLVVESAIDEKQGMQEGKIKVHVAGVSLVLVSYSFFRVGGVATEQHKCCYPAYLRAKNMLPSESSQEAMRGARATNP